MAVATLGCLGLLTVSGAWLGFRYRPDRPAITPGARFVRFPDHGGGWVGDVHHVVALALYVSLAGFVVALLAPVVRRRLTPWVAGPVTAAVAATIVARSSGEPLPWSQLGLWAVKVNTDYAGVWKAAYDPSVRFVLTGTERTQAEYRRLVLTHLFAAPALLVVTLLAAALCLRAVRR